MSIARFYVRDLPSTGEHVDLPSDEARHAIQVLRVKPDDQVILFDGLGGEALASVALIDARRCNVTVRERTDTDRELAYDLSMFVALPKGDRQRVLIEGLTQFGVTRLVPICTERSVAQPTTKTVGRLRRFVLEASKQCGRNRLMQVEEGLSISQIGTAPDPGSLLAHPCLNTEVLATQTTTADLLDANPVRIVIGPEGGLTSGEVTKLIQDGWKQLSLGPRILRVEMAALYAAAMVNFAKQRPF